MNRYPQLNLPARPWPLRTASCVSRKARPLELSETSSKTICASADDSSEGPPKSNSRSATRRSKGVRSLKSGPSFTLRGCDVVCVEDERSLKFSSSLTSPSPAATRESSFEFSPALSIKSLRRPRLFAKPEAGSSPKMMTGHGAPCHVTGDRSLIENHNLHPPSTSSSIVVSTSPLTLPSFKRYLKHRGGVHSSTSATQRPLVSSAASVNQKQWRSSIGSTLMTNAIHCGTRVKSLSRANTCSGVASIFICRSYFSISAEV